ncbi:DUF2971 domain-containing protein [Pseudomonas sp. HK3]|jgi:hypothetical protein
MTKVGHYTSQAGILGIISTQLIRASNIKFLNDEQEFLHALDLIKEIILTSKITNDSPEFSVHSKYIEAIKKKLESLDQYTTESIYTFSVSKEIDLLSQWRGYCPQNNGYCLVMNIDKVFISIKNQHANSHLVECVYDQEEKNKSLKILLNEYWEKYKNKESNKEKNNVINELSEHLALFASHFKHPSFSEEKEWRIVVILDNAADESIKFREGISSLIPFIELKIKRNDISSVKIGPTSSKNLTSRALSLFMENAYGTPFTMPDIEFSETPYRPW